MSPGWGSLDPPRRFVYSYSTVRASHDPRLIVGLIGLGNMGTAIVERLLEAGYPLPRHESNAREGGGPRSAVPGVASTPRDLAAQVDVIITRSPTTTRWRRCDGRHRLGAAGQRPGRREHRLAGRRPGSRHWVEAAAVEYLRAPVSGNPSVVRAGTWTFIVSGAPETLERVELVLLAIGPPSTMSGTVTRPRR